jgi:hypothetical protein
LFYISLLLLYIGLDRVDFTSAPVFTHFEVVVHGSVCVHHFRAFSAYFSSEFCANVAIFDRKIGAYVKIWALFTGGAAHFSPPKTHDTVSIGYP